jgi:predicted small lipoprotein YifL
MRDEVRKSLAVKVLTPLLAGLWLAGLAGLAGCGQKGPLTLSPGASAPTASAPAR